MYKHEDPKSKDEIEDTAVTLTDSKASMDLLAYARYLQSEHEVLAPAAKETHLDAYEKLEGNRLSEICSLSSLNSEHDDSADLSKTHAFRSPLNDHSAGLAKIAESCRQFASNADPTPRSIEHISEMVENLPSVWKIVSAKMPELFSDSPEIEAWYSSQGCLKPTNPPRFESSNLNHTVPEVNDICAKSGNAALYSPDISFSNLTSGPIIKNTQQLLELDLQIGKAGVPALSVSEKKLNSVMLADSEIACADVNYPLPGPGLDSSFVERLLAHLNGKFDIDETPSQDYNVLTLVDGPLPNAAPNSVHPDLEAAAIVGFSTDDFPASHLAFGALDDGALPMTQDFVDPGLSYNN